MTTLKDLDGRKVAVAVPGKEKPFRMTGVFCEPETLCLTFTDDDTKIILDGDFNEELIKSGENHGCDYYIDLDARHG